MLDFLTGGGGGANLSGTMSGIGSLLNLFGAGKPKVNYGPTPSEAQASSLFQALLDPNNSLVKQNTDINMQKGMQDFLMQLKQMQMMDARRNARGTRGTFFQPERADEVVNYLTTRGMPAVAERARATAKNDINTVAQGLMGNALLEQIRMNDRNFNRQNAYDTLQGKGGIGGLGRGIGTGAQDMFKVLFGSRNDAVRPNDQFVGPMPQPYSSGWF
jgi:hypothetical protein